MKKLLLMGLVSLICGVSLFLFSNQAFAIITFVDTTEFTQTGTNPSEDYESHNTWWGSNVQWLSGIGDWVRWTHHFSFIPPAEEILAGTLTLTLFDNDPCDGCFRKEYAFGWGEDGSWDFGEVDPGTYNYSVNVHYLEDGAYTVTLASLWGNFGICRSDLEITYTPVPEPSTIFLLGFGLLGAGLFKRKRISM